MSADLMQCGCYYHYDFEEDCRYPILRRYAYLLRQAHLHPNLGIFQSAVNELEVKHPWLLKEMEKEK